MLNRKIITNWHIKIAKNQSNKIIIKEKIWSLIKEYNLKQKATENSLLKIPPKTKLKTFPKQKQRIIFN